VFQAIQGHWLSASLRVMLELKVADILVKQAPTDGMDFDQVSDAW
jgi:hypothetical protein